MDKAIEALAGTPLPTILVLAGILFIFFAIGGQFGAQVVTDRIKPRAATIVGVLLLIFGVGIHLFPASESSAVPPAPIPQPSLGLSPGISQQPDVGISARLTFTSALDDRDMPVDSLTEISKDMPEIYLHANWFGLTAGKPYHYDIEVYDGGGSLINSDSLDFTSDGTSYYTWSSYQIKPIDQPGAWRFNVGLNGQTVQSYLMVRDDDQPSTTEVSARVIFTSSLNEDNQPVDNLSEFPISGGQVTAFVTWFELTPGFEYTDNCKIFDGGGGLVYSEDLKFVPDGSSHSTWCYYTFTAIDKPGVWKFRLSIDDTVTERELSVTPN